MDGWVSWGVAGVSIFGIVLNVRRRSECFLLWAGTNAFWAVVDYTHGLYAQAFLQLIYFALSLWGLAAWSRKTRHQTTGR